MINKTFKRLISALGMLIVLADYGYAQECAVSDQSLPLSGRHVVYGADPAHDVMLNSLPHSLMPRRRRSNIRNPEQDTRDQEAARLEQEALAQLAHRLGLLDNPGSAPLEMPDHIDERFYEDTARYWASHYEDIDYEAVMIRMTALGSARVNEQIESGAMEEVRSHVEHASRHVGAGYRQAGICFNYWFQDNLPDGVESIWGDVLSLFFDVSESLVSLYVPGKGVWNELGKFAVEKVIGEAAASVTPADDDDPSSSIERVTRRLSDEMPAQLIAMFAPCTDDERRRADFRQICDQRQDAAIQLQAMGFLQWIDNPPGSIGSAGRGTRPVQGRVEARMFDAIGVPFNHEFTVHQTQFIVLSQAIKAVLGQYWNIYSDDRRDYVRGEAMYQAALMMYPSRLDIRCYVHRSFSTILEQESRNVNCGLRNPQ